MTEEMPQEEKQIPFKSGNLAYAINYVPSNKTYSLIIEQEEMLSPEAHFVMMILIRERLTVIRDNEVKSLMAFPKERDRKQRKLMSKTELNKHVHAIELLNRYVAEISSLFAEDLEAVLNTSLPNEEQL